MSFGPNSGVGAPPPSGKSWIRHCRYKLDQVNIAWALQWIVCLEAVLL